MEWYQDLRQLQGVNAHRPGSGLVLGFHNHGNDLVIDFS